MVQIDHIFFIWPSTDGHLGWLYNHFCVYFVCAWGFPGGYSGKEPSCQVRRQEMWVRSLGREDPPEEGMATTTQVSLPGGSYGQRSLAGYSPWGHRVRLPVIPELRARLADCQHYLHVHLPSSDNLPLSVVREHLGFIFEPWRKIRDQDWTLCPAQGTLWPRLPSVFPQPQDHPNMGRSMRERWKDLTKSN